MLNNYGDIKNNNNISPGKNLSRIKILPESLISKIAAGEVVEKPASVVKELVENSIDAGSSFIQIEIKESGISEIVVIDNGWGMDDENAILALQRFATSKISEYNDLENISTLGFRGEALPSIASVSKMEIKTSTENGKGLFIRVESGNIIDKKSIGLPRGTEITVRDLFYNVPARKKFLKSKSTEFNSIVNTLDNLAIAYPDIHFKFISDDKLIFDLPVSQDAKSRLASLWGIDIVKGMVAESFKDGDLSIDLLLGHPSVARKKSNFQRIIVNGRPVKEWRLNRVVEEAYGTLLPQDKKPVFVLFLWLPNNLVDVNVHPAKLEVRFRDEWKIFSWVKNKVRLALQTSLVIAGDDIKIQDIKKFYFKKKEVKSLSSRKKFTHQLEMFLTSFPDRIDKSISKVTDEKTFDEELEKPVIEFDYWQYKGLYIFIATEGGVWILDQHAVHERILFEQILKKLDGEEIESAQMLFNVVVDLSLKDWEIFNQYEHYFKKIGFEIKRFGGRTVTIESIPSFYGNPDPKQLFIDILESLSEDKLEIAHNEKIASAFACKSAIKQGVVLSKEDVTKLLDDLFSCEIPFTCPHGRPTIIKLSLDELEKRFKRK